MMLMYLENVWKILLVLYGYNGIVKEKVVLKLLFYIFM